jgi:hypothetical protein
MKLSLTIATLAALLLSAVVQAEKKTTSTSTSSLRRGLKSGKKNAADDYFALISSSSPDQQEVPSCMPSALSSANVVATVRDNLFCIRLSYDGLSSPELFSHVHGPNVVGKTGPVIFTIDASTEKKQCFELTKDQKKDLDNELWYFDIHSEKCPGSAIRGQILPLVSNIGTIVQQLRQRQPAEAVTEALI